MPLQIIRQDITKMHCDAIVNTTNSRMVGYSGVDLAVHVAAGPLLDEECRTLVPLELGFAKYTKGYDLDCKYIIHTSGPTWYGGRRGEKALLKSCYVESLNLAKKLKCESVAFPLISSGNYGYPKDLVLKDAVNIISEFLNENEMDVYICVYDKTSYELSKAIYYDILGYLRKNGIELSTERGIDNFTDIDFTCNDSRNYNNEQNIRQTLFAECCCLEIKKEIPHNEVLSTKKSADVDLTSFLKTMDKSFMETLFSLIDKKNMTDAEFYKKANVDRKTFSKLKSNPNQKPSRSIAVAFVVALEMNLEDSQNLLARAGLTLSTTQKFDMIVRYFIEHNIYDINEINMALFEFDQLLLGSK